MTNTSLFRQATILLVLIAFLEISADLFYFHWTYWWFDMFLHFISGVCVAMASIVFLSFNFRLIKSSKFWMIFTTLIIVLVIGILWEIFELFIGATSLSDGVIYIKDTKSDIFLDLLGGFLGALYGLSSLSKEKTHHNG